MRILAFGEVMMRMMPPDYKTLTQTHTLEFLFTGTGVNVLSGLYQMGHDVSLMTRLPDNAVGKAASAYMRQLGISDKYIVYGDQHIGIYFLEKGYGNRASQVTYLNRIESSFGKSQMTDYDISCLDNIDILHICGITFALNETLREVALALISVAKNKGIKIVFDCNFRPSLWQDADKDMVCLLYEKILNQADIVFAGAKDATLLLGKTTNQKLAPQKQLYELLEKMANDYRIEAIFGTTRDNDNLVGYMFKNHQLIVSRSYPLVVYDRVGAGDGFAAGALHGYLSNMEDQKLIDYATVSGVLAHTTYGDSPIMNQKDILDFLKHGYVDIKR